MKKIVLFLSLIFVGLSDLTAQPAMPDKCQAFYPDVLLSNAVITETNAQQLEASSVFGQDKAPRNKTFWVVYSDRDENITYTAPDGGTKYSSLSLNERLRIAQIKNGYALVYTEPQADIPYPQISQFAECKGWISMKKLLLWHSCPADEYEIYQKALLCVNLEEVGAGNAGNSDIGKLYLNPENKRKHKVLSTNMQFYYVMKREGDLVLLANTHTLDGRSDNVLLGWVTSQSYVAWNQRSCLEKTWDKRDAEYFADEGIRIDIYEMESGKCATQLSFKRKQATGNDPHLYRTHKDQLRFPILDGSTETQYKCSTFGTKEGGSVVVNDQEYEGELGYSEEVLQQMTNINIGIVIDGTSSMEPFYPAVKDAIKEGAKFFDEKKYNVKVGLVIYRDYSDGEFVTEKFPLTRAGNPNLDKWLDSGGRYGIQSNPKDKTLEEAMYEGINVALDELGFNPDQSNLLLVVGDCGNDRFDNKYSQEEIIDKLVDKNVHMMGFQVRKGSEDAFQLFDDQMLDIIRLSTVKKYEKNVKYTGAVKWERMKDGYRIVNDEKSNIFIGSHNEPLPGQQLPTSRLSTLMQEAIEYTSNSVQFQINLLTSLQLGNFSGSDVDTETHIDEEFLKWKLGEEMYERFGKDLMAFKGYADKKHKSGRSFFKPVVFISSDELNTLIERLAPVNSAAVRQHSDREPYVNAMKALVQVMDPSVTDERINSYGINQIMRMIAGLNEAAGALTGDYTIAEIADPLAVSNVEYLSLVQRFTKKYDGLRRLKQQEYKYTYTVNGLKYYWLPVEDLP